MVADESRDEGFLREVRGKATRLSESRRHPGAFWRHVAHVGSLGFVFVLPLVVGAALGHRLAERTGRPAHALIPLLVGLVFGGFASWRMIRQSLDEDPKE